MTWFLGTDNDGHWYLVPADRREEWRAWIGLPSNDERTWTHPRWALALGGSPSSVVFTDPVY